MSTGFEEYTQRMWSYVGDADPLSLMRAAPARFAALLAHPEFRPPAPGKWNVRQIAAHLADAELVVGYRIRKVLAEGDAARIEAFDESLWANALHYDAIDASHSLRRFTALRESLVDLLGGLTDEELDRAGIHAERGRESVRDMIRLYAGHDINHFLQIEALRG